MELEKKFEGEVEVKRTSKLTAMIASKNDEFNGLQITVYYSENNWETCEEVNLIMDENSTINQLIDSAVYKFKTELFYDNIDTKQFNVKLFKKKKKIPNDEYPICNPESEVKNYGKTHFCLVEDIKAEKEEVKTNVLEIKKDEEKTEVNKKIGEENNNNKKDNKKNTNDEFDKEIKNYKVCSPKICIIF